jgi:hypothetical protein
MIYEIEEYLYDQGYYGQVDHEFIDSITLIIAEHLCNRFCDKDGGEVLDKDFEVLRERIGGLLCS